ncbi:hypothetical protein [Hymenobacter sp. HDW8]|uniref:hypothetical protein n=1 Tax=Hymenobacter sp. HDW8 TaxID=2714932 RepID=UPI001409C1BF|nr:hypothetical protein [Hymenobacter sp. HDW8]QIL77384.1 hypothetical protein G7064_17185 [Hymenobacter sp. HDW8]
MRHTLRYLAFFLLSGIILAGCKSADKVLFKATPASLTSRLPALQVDVDNSLLMVSEATEYDDARKMFEQELNQNIIDADDSTKFGYVKLQIMEASVSRPRRAVQVFQMMTLLTPSMLGVPLGWYCSRVRAEVQLYDAHGELLGTYAGTGQSSVRVAMYHGYSQSDAPRLADIIALRHALDQIRPQLEVDAAALKTEFANRGPVEVIMGQTVATSPN